MRDAVIVSAVRTPTGKFMGTLKGFTAPQLGAMVVKEAVRRSGIDPSRVDEVIMGNVLSAGVGQAPARQAALGAGLPNTVGALTINKVCGSGLKAVMLAAQGIATGDVDVVVAGGMESMSNAPYLLPKAREGMRLGHGQLVDSMIHDGLWDVYNDEHMGCCGEVVAEKHAVSRQEQDAYALDSHQKAIAATKAGKFKDEILPVPIPQKKGEPVDVRGGRVAPRGHVAGGAREAEGGLQGRRDGDRGQRAGRERRRGGAGGDVRRRRRGRWVPGRWRASWPRPRRGWSRGW